MVADGPDPAVFADQRVGEHDCEFGAVVDQCGAHVDRIERGRGSAQMHVVIMQTRDYRPTVGVIDLLAG